MKKKIGIAFLVIAGLLVVIQFIPFGKDHTNPKVVAEPKWDSMETRTQFMKSCGDCHSHETKWPAYSNVAPISWLVFDHVEEGREHFNVSNWGHQKKNEGDEAAEELEEGEMPLTGYVLLHPESKMDDAQTKKFIEGLKRTFGEEKKSEKESHDD